MIARPPTGSQYYIIVWPRSPCVGAQHRGESTPGIGIPFFLHRAQDLWLA